MHRVVPLHPTIYRNSSIEQLFLTRHPELYLESEGSNLLLAHTITPTCQGNMNCHSICHILLYFVIGVIGIIVLLYVIRLLYNFIFSSAPPPRFSELSQEDLKALHIQAQRSPNSWKKYLEELDIDSRSALLMGWYHARLPPLFLQNLSMEWNALLREGMPNLNAAIFMEVEKIFTFTTSHPNQLAWHVQMLKYAPPPEGSAINYPLCAIFELNIALKARGLTLEWGPNFSQLLIDYALSHDRYGDFLYQELLENSEQYGEMALIHHLDFSRLFEQQESRGLENDISVWLEAVWEDDENPEQGLVCDTSC